VNRPTATREACTTTQRDEADLAKFGYRQELRRTLGVFSSFAVAFSYISPSTGIFTLFFLGLTTIGGVFFELPELLHLQRRRAARARLRGWPRAKAPFALGKWGLPVGLAYGGAMLVNFAWPRAATNPRPNEIGKLLNFHWGWLNAKPVLWTVLGAILLVGGVYSALVQRLKPAHLQAPEGEVFAEEVPEAPPAPTV
jgi:hypothetical protein